VIWQSWRQRSCLRLGFPASRLCARKFPTALGSSIRDVRITCDCRFRTLKKPFGSHFAARFGYSRKSPDHPTLNDVGTIYQGGQSTPWTVLDNVSQPEVQVLTPNHWTCILFCHAADRNTAASNRGILQIVVHGANIRRIFGPGAVHSSNYK
jgi:hypothetical protein